VRLRVLENGRPATGPGVTHESICPPSSAFPTWCTPAHVRIRRVDLVRADVVPLQQGHLIEQAVCQAVRGSQPRQPGTDDHRPQRRPCVCPMSEGS
jgi:hypothetical protein